MKLLPRTLCFCAVAALCATTGCEVDLARNNQITESGLDLGYRNRHRSLNMH